MQSRIELEIEHIHERLRAERASAEQRRRVSGCARTAGLGRRAARPLAQLLLAVGARLLSYANAERTPIVATSPRNRAVELN